MILGVDARQAVKRKVRLDVLLRHRLLLQPRGLEGVILFDVVLLDPHDLARRGVVDEQSQRRRCRSRSTPLAPSVAPRRCRDRHATRSLSVDRLELASMSQEAPRRASSRPAMTRLDPSRDRVGTVDMPTSRARALDRTRRSQPEQSVAPVDASDASTHDLHVLLRHRPRSISLLPQPGGFEANSAEQDPVRERPTRAGKPPPNDPVLSNPNSRTEATVHVPAEKLPLAEPVAGRDPDHAAGREPHDPHLAMTLAAQSVRANAAVEYRAVLLEDHPRAVDDARHPISNCQGPSDGEYDKHGKYEGNEQPSRHRLPAGDDLAASIDLRPRIGHHLVEPATAAEDLGATVDVVDSLPAAPDHVVAPRPSEEVIAFCRHGSRRHRGLR